VEKLRVFLGIGPAEEGWAKELETWRHEIRDKSIRWVRSENLHITLRFFGSVAREEISQITERITPIINSTKPFRLHAERLSLFPNERRPRVAAVECVDESGELGRLEHAIRKQTAMFGQAPENRKFRPHLTFGRIREMGERERRLLIDAWEKQGAPPLEDWLVRDVKLYMSELRSGDSIYTPLAVIELQGE
jgi:RNA 2',3'-cyclic 3'-phosphodiesterase